VRQARSFWLLILGVFSLFYFSDIVLRASGKHFWFDEIYTVNLCRIPSFHDLQQAVLHGADYNPPLFYLLTRWTGGPFGYDLIGTRLPAMLGVWIACLSLFFLVAPRFGSVSGFITMMFPLFTAAKYYAYEARPHGIVVGCAGLAALAWQRIHTSHRRWMWLAVLCLALTTAALTHVYGVTLCIPIGLAELAFSLRRRRLDWAVFGAMIVAPVAAAPFLLALMRTYKTVVVNSGTNFFPPHFSSIARFYEFLLGPAASIIALSLLLILMARIYERDPSNARQPEDFLDGSVILALSFLALPVMAVGLAIVTKGPFIERYSLSAVIGAALIIGVGTSSLGRRRWIAFSIAALLSCSFLLDTSRLWKRHHAGMGESLVEPSSSSPLNTTPGKPLDGYDLLLANPEQTLPVVLLSGLDYTYLNEYVPQWLQPRLWYVDQGKDDNLGQLARAVRDWCHLPYNVSSRQEFRSAHPQFLVYGRANMFALFLGSKDNKNLQVRSIGAAGDYILAEVTTPDR